MIKYQNSTIDKALAHFEAAVSSLRAGVELIAAWDSVSEEQQIPVYSSLDALAAEILRRKESAFAPESLPSPRK